MSRRRGANEVKTAQIQHLLAPSFPIFAPFLGNLGELQSDSTLPNVYVALDLIDNAIVRFCGSNLAMNFLRQNPRPVHSMERMKSGALDIYMNSLSFVRQTLTQDEEMSEGMGNAMLGTVVCLAFYDVSNHVSVIILMLAEKTQSDAKSELPSMEHSYERINKDCSGTGGVSKA